MTPPAAARLCEECATLVENHDKIRALSHAHRNVAQVCVLQRQAKAEERQHFLCSSGYWRSSLLTVVCVEAYCFDQHASFAHVLLFIIKQIQLSYNTTLVVCRGVVQTDSHTTSGLQQ